MLRRLSRPIRAAALALASAIRTPPFVRSACRPASSAMVVVTAALAMTAVQCVQALGLDDFFNCPQDPRCPTCSDGKKNGDETDVDCGGDCPDKCAAGKACSAAADCESGMCSGGTCDAPPAPSCSDGEKNGQETDVDCGGPACGKCADGKGCSNGADCASKVCTGGTCLAPACGDMLQNGDETDVDCGGATCGKCDVGKGCAGDADCQGGTCGVDGKCAATCTDGVKDGDETDVDCGGAGCPKCAVTEGCATGPDCATGVCQGGACVSYYGWAKNFGDSNNQAGVGVATDPLGNIYTASWLSGTANFGGADVTVATSGNYLAIAKFDSAGTHGWSKAFPSATASAVGIAVDPLGNSVVAGTAATGANFGSGTLTGAANDNIFVARFDTGGNHLSSKLFPNANGLAVATGSVRYAVAGLALQQGSVNFGCGNLTPKGILDGIVGVFTPANACAWSKRIGFAGGVTSATAVAVDSGDNIIVAFEGVNSTTDFGCGPIATPPGVANVLVKFAEITGACLWNTTFGNKNADPGSFAKVSGIGIDAAGNITIAGNFTTHLDIGTASFTSAGFAEIFVAQFDDAGTFKWAKQFTNAMGSGKAPALSVSTGGNVAITGTTTAGTDFGGGPLANDAPFLAEFDPAGQHLWSRGFATVDIAYLPLNMINGVAYLGAHEVVLTGNFPGKIDLGDGSLTTAGGFDMFLAKLLVP